MRKADHQKAGKTASPPKQKPMKGLAYNYQSALEDFNELMNVQGEKRPAYVSLGTLAEAGSEMGGYVSFKQKLREAFADNFKYLKYLVGNYDLDNWLSSETTIVLDKRGRYDPPVRRFRFWLEAHPDPADSKKAELFDKLLWEALQEGDGIFDDVWRAFRQKLNAVAWTWKHRDYGLRAREVRKTSGKLGGSKPKRREVIYRAIVDNLKDSQMASNQKIWDSFPEGRDDAKTVGELRYSVFREGANLYEVDSGGKVDKLHWIGRRKFDEYVTAARDELGISTRTKKRLKKS